MRTIFARSVLWSLLLALGLSACSFRAGVMSVISAQRVALSENNRASKKVTGESCSVLSMADLDEAVRDAMSKAGPGYDALAGAIVTYKVIPFYHNCYNVTGTPINTSPGAAAAAPAEPAPAPAQQN